MLAKKISKSQYDSSFSDYHISSLAEIYQQQINMCIWERELSTNITRYVRELINENNWSMRSVVDVKTIEKEVYSAMPDLSDDQGRLALSNDVSILATLFSDLFELSTIGIRFSLLSTKMCPRFHSDNVPCRLVTTYIGTGTQWLPDHLVDRSKLGYVSAGVPDSESGIYASESDIQQLSPGDVGLMKGSGWQGCTHPLVHRSPDIGMEGKRLILTLDFAN